MILNKERMIPGSNFYVVRVVGGEQNTFTATVLAVVPSELCPSEHLVFYEWSQLTGKGAFAKISKSHLEYAVTGSDANDPRMVMELDYLMLRIEDVQAIAEQSNKWDACIHSSISERKDLHTVHLKSPKTILKYWDYYSRILPEYALEGDRPWLRGHTAVTTSKTWRL